MDNLIWYVTLKYSKVGNPVDKLTNLENKNQNKKWLFIAFTAHFLWNLCNIIIFKTRMNIASRITKWLG